MNALSHSKRGLGTDLSRPPLKTAMVFGGIAGIMSAENGDPDDLGHITSINSKTRELGELQDMYRRTLAASWAGQAGELPPDKLVEDLFAGGTGMSMNPPPRPSPNPQRAEEDSSASVSEGDSKRGVQEFSHQPVVRGHAKGSPSTHSRNDSKSMDASSTGSGVSGRGSIEQQVHHSNKEKKRRSYKPANEVTEFDVREDLKSWAISAKG